MRSFFQGIMSYDHSANREMIDILRMQPRIPQEKLVRLTSHLLAAHHYWNRVILGKSPMIGLWEPLLPDAWSTVALENHDQSQRIIAGRPLSRVIICTDPNGVRTKHTIMDILFHLVDRSAHLRGRIAESMLMEGIDPPTLDHLACLDPDQDPA